MHHIQAQRASTLVARMQSKPVWSINAQPKGFADWSISQALFPEGAREVLHGIAEVEKNGYQLDAFHRKLRRLAQDTLDRS